MYTRGLDVTQAVIANCTSLEVNLGLFSGSYNSLASQIGFLRTQISAPPAGSAWESVANGSIPLAVYVRQADMIAHLLKLQRDLGFKLVIIGGDECHLFATQLAAQNVSVILSPYSPLAFPAWHQTPSAMQILSAAGVNVGITEPEESYARNLRWEAGLAASLGTPSLTALRSFTKNIALAYSLPIPNIF